MISVLLGFIAIACTAIILVIAAILIGAFFTGLIGGIILLVTGNALSKDSKRKVARRVCFIVGMILLIIAGCSAGVIINFIAQMIA